MGTPNGIWTSVSGGMAQAQSIDTIANNIANINTTGFKKDTPSFKEYLTAVERPPSPLIDIPRTIFKDSDFYHTDGKEHAMVNLDRMHTDHSQGNLKPTNSQLDAAIEGPGYFAVRTPTGVQFTRAGNFKMDGEGRLVTVDGYPVLSLTGELGGEAPPPLAAADTGNANARTPAGLNPFSTQAAAQANAQSLFQEINLKDISSQGNKIHISESGQIFSGEQEVAKIAVAEFSDSKLLVKTNSTLFSNPNPANVPRSATNSRVRQGFIEMSNVNAVSELSDLIKANRMFESNMRAIKTYHEMSAKEANEVGKL